MPNKPMAELRSLVGETRETVDGLRVGRNKILEFVRAIGDDDPVYRDPEVARRRGYQGVPAQLTFTRSALFEHNRPEGYTEDHNFELGFERGSRLHGRQEYEFERPVVAGDVLSGETMLVDIYQREGKRGGTMTFGIFETEYFDSDGCLVVTERLNRIEVDEMSDEDNGEVGDSSTSKEFDEVSTAGTWSTEIYDRYPTDGSDASVGDIGPRLTIENLEVRDFVRYAGASGDFNRMHYDREYARSKGSPDVFVQGMLVAGYTSSVVSRWLGVEAVDTFSVQFNTPVWVGDSITATAEIADITTRGSERSIEVSLTVTNQREDLVLAREATTTVQKS